MQFGKFIDNDYITQYHHVYLLNRDYNAIDSIFPDGLGKNLALSSMLYNKLIQNQILEDSILYRFSKKVNHKVIQNQSLEKMPSWIYGSIKPPQISFLPAGD